MKTYRTYSSAETECLGSKLAEKILGRGSRENGATVIAFTGELGSGKTTFVKGFFKGLGVRKRVTSPTFVLVRRTRLNERKAKRGKGRAMRFENVYHVDAYRIKKPQELLLMGLEETFHDPQNIVLIEWAEKLKRVLPINSSWLKFDYGKKENDRKITFK